jgi:recombination associated protein RdgC
MLFKQAQIFRLSAPVLSDRNALEEQLTKLEYTPCLPSLPFSYGWVSPIDNDEAPLVHVVNRHFLICMQVEEKILPAIVVRQELNKKIKEIECTQGRKVSHKEKYALKDEITQSLLPRAFSKLSRFIAYIEPENNWLVIDTTTSSKVEIFLKLLKRSLSEASCIVFETKKIPKILTQWLVDDTCPRSFFIEQSCVLRDPNLQSRIIRCQHQDLSDSAIQLLLNDGCEVHQISLKWGDKISFTLVDDFTLKSISYDDELFKEIKENNFDTEDQKYDADFFIITELLSKLWEQLIYLFGKDPIKNIVPK